MKLIFIYGPPAAGKLTVARELARRTNFKVFHNHLSIDCIEPIFPFGSESFGKLIDIIRYETVAEAARVNQNLIYTFCYAKDLDDSHVEKIIEAAESNGGEVHFASLSCERSVLENRVIKESRQEFGKIKNLPILNQLLDRYDLFSPVNARESLIIDNTDLSVEDAAGKIIEYYGLI